MPIAGGGVIRRSSAAFCSAIPAFLSVSLLLLSYRSILHIAAGRVASVLERDPDVRSLLTRLSSSPTGHDPERRADHHNHHNHHHGAGTSRRPRGPPSYLHLTRVGTLDDDFFSDADYAAADHPLHHRHRGRPFNSTLLVSPNRLLHLVGGGDRESLRHLDSGKIRVSDPPASPVLFFLAENGGGGDGKAEEGERRAGVDIEIRIFGQSFHLDRRDATVLAYLMTLFSVVYLFATVGFLSCYSCATGVVFLAVADFLLGRRHRPFLKTLNDGCRLGVKRVLVFVFLRWVVRDALAQLLCILFFSDVSDQHLVLKLFVRVKLMPFLLTASPLTQWARGDDGNLWWFILVWGTLNRISDLVLFAFSFWVALTERNQRRRGPEVLWEGFRLVLSMMNRAFLLRHVEMMICWNSGGWILSAIGGPVFAAIVQSVAEVYFMVVWLMCYFDARCREGELNGRRFGRRNLEDCINDLG